MALPDFGLKVSGDLLTPLTHRLDQLGYHETAIRDLLGLTDTAELVGKQLPFYEYRCQSDGSDLATLVSFFLLGGGVDRETLHRLLGPQLLSVLMECGAVVGFAGVFTSQVVLYPCLGRYFFTDYWYTEGQQTEGKIYEIGTDSYVLARVTPRHRVTTSLDLCTGSGIHAVMSASSSRATAVDINPRALRYTAANAALNGVEVEAQLGDLYSPLPGDRRFDLITANPPFVPSPDPVVLIHRSPGETGEEVSRRIVAGLPERLTEDGLFSMILEYPVMENDDYPDRLERWLGQTSGWGIAVLWYIEKAPGEYIVQHMGPVPSYKDTFNRYLESYQRHGITAIRFASVFIKRLPTDRPNWKVIEKTVWPRVEVAEQMRFWLDCLTRYNDPGWCPEPSWKPAMSRYYKSVWRDWDEARGVLEMSDDNWIQPTPLNADETRLMLSLREGDRSVEELRSGWDDDTRFMAALRALGLRRALS